MLGGVDSVMDKSDVIRLAAAGFKQEGIDECIWWYRGVDCQWQAVVGAEEIEFYKHTKDLRSREAGCTLTPEQFHGFFH